MNKLEIIVFLIAWVVKFVKYKRENGLENKISGFAGGMYQWERSRLQSFRHKKVWKNLTLYTID